MGRNTADALCIECGEEFEWLIGNLRICKDCLLREVEKKKDGRKNG